jgi:hypothetical protein
MSAISSHEAAQAQRFARQPAGDVRPLTLAELQADRRFRPQPVPERSLQQRMDALQKGNEIRVQRAQLKRDIKACRVSVHDVLLEPPVWAETMKVGDLLIAVPKVGRVKVNKLLVQARVSHSKTLGGLTDRQRAEIASMVRR